MAIEQSPLTLNSENVTTDISNNVSANESSAGILLHELQLGECLNDSVVQARRADFSLMLAMLAEDVREQSQFVLPRPAKPEATLQSNKALRKELNLPNQAPLCLESLSDINQFNQVKSIVDNDLAHIHLVNALVPKALSFRDDKNHLPTNVLQNTSLCCQLKYKNAVMAEKQQSVTEETFDKLLNDPINKPLIFNAKKWLQGVQQSLVQAPLIN
ncbi:VC2046/SO_2500 family protein [Colwelliaceae bacterium MEBiC 14330]